MDEQKLAELRRISQTRKAIENGELRRLREAAHLAEKDVGDALGVAAATISRWETGARTPRREVVLQVAELMDFLKELSDE